MKRVRNPLSGSHGPLPKAVYERGKRCTVRWTGSWELKLRLLSAMGCLGTLAAAPSSQPTSRPTFSEQAFRQRYAVLSEKNIFLKDRGPRERDRSGRDRDREADRVVPPEKAYLLVGLVEEEDGASVRAYFENSAAGGVAQVRPGDELAGFKVLAIDLDMVTMQLKDRVTTVLIGQDLTGRSATPTTSSSSSSTASSSQPSDPSTMSAVERLKARRAAEMGSKK